jgi:hypothetical protein
MIWATNNEKKAVLNIIHRPLAETNQATGSALRPPPAAKAGVNQ